MNSRSLDTSPSTLALRLAITALGNSLLVAGMNLWLPQYITILGGVAAAIIIGSLITLLNATLRPLLKLATFPLALVWSLPTTIGINVLFLAVVHAIVLRMDPEIVVLVISGGLPGWIVLSTIIGLCNWIIARISG